MTSAAQAASTAPPDGGYAPPSNTGSNSGTSIFLSLIANPFQSQVQATSFYASVAWSLGLGTLLAAGFCLLRPRTSNVYAPRAKHADKDHAPPAVGKGFFSWFDPIRSARETELIEKIGLDAAVFLRFLRMTRNIFVVLSVVCCGVLIPVNLAGGHSSSSQYGDIYVFMKLTPQYSYGNKFWAFVVVAYIMTGVIFFFLWTNYRAVYRLRRQYFESYDFKNSLHSRTLLLRHVPSPMQSDEGLVRLIQEIKTMQDTPTTAIGRNVRDLPDLIEEHENAVQKLEGYLAKYLADPDRLPAQRPRCKPSKFDVGLRGDSEVDAIEYYTKRISELENKIIAIRESVDRRSPESYGFASYTYIEDAHSVAYSARKGGPQNTEVLLAPRPADIIWRNLPLSRAMKRTQTYWNTFWIVLLTIAYIPPNVLTAVFLSDFGHLGEVWPAFKKSLYAHPTLYGILQGILAPLIQTSFYLILPMIFRRLSSRAGDITKTSRERHVANKLYAFFVFNNLFVFSVFASIWRFIAAVKASNEAHESVWQAIKDSHFAQTISAGLCNISPYWVTWQMQRNLSAAVDLIQAWPLIRITLMRRFSAPTPRQLVELTAPQPFEYAEYYNNYMFVATSALAFATLQPLVVPIAAFYIAVDYWLKTYMLQYIFITKIESGGMFWRNMYNRYLFAVILANAVIALVAGAQGSASMVYAMIPMIGVVAGFKFYCARAFDDGMHYYNINSSDVEGSVQTIRDRKTKRSQDKVAVRYGHPALYRKLMTPMVHAKAQQMLRQVYHGRTGSYDGAFASDRPQSGMAFSDIYMTELSRDGKSTMPTGRKSSHTFVPSGDTSRSLPFELVPENQLDFENYKNRPDFADAYGGGGELYGVPEDRFSRPGTPGTMMSDTTRVDAEEETTYPRGYHMAGEEIERVGSPLRNPLRGVDIPDARIGRIPTGQDEEGRRLLANAARMGRSPPPPPTAAGRAGTPTGMPRRKPIGHGPSSSAGSVGIAPTPGERTSTYDYFGTDSRGGSGRNTPSEREGETSYDYFRRGGGRR